MIRILIVEDEKPISNLIRLSLTKAGYHCTCVYDGNAAVDKLDRAIFDLILLDIMLPGANGFELMDYIRPLGIPVIFLTAVNSVNNRVRGLKMGAEDYIIKPFEIVELLARVEVVLRRYNKMIQHLHAAGIDIDTVSMTVKRDDEEIQLTNKEYELLLLLPEIRASHFTKKPFTSGYGAESMYRVPEPLSCIYSACAKRSAGKKPLLPFQKSVTDWWTQHEI